MAKASPKVARRDVFSVFPRFKFPKQNPLRKEIAQMYKNGRALYSPAGKEYTYVRGDLLFEANQELQKRFGGGKPVRFLDAGAGRGGVLDYVTAIYRGKVIPYGLSLLNPPEESAFHPTDGKRNKQWFVGSFENTLFPNYFDVIQSRLGLKHAINHTVAIENLLNSLRHKGTLVFTENDLLGSNNGRENKFVNQALFDAHSTANESQKLLLESKHPFLQYKRLFDLLERQGFSAQYFTKSAVHVIGKKRVAHVLLNNSIKITKIRKGAKADLSELYAHPFINRVPLVQRR